ncbi:MAG: PAS domain S-box protein, partial [Pseudobdellovibrionaceae bacterium]|nr:PAS domain S-box protein [Pseudobdellovibrionaceae bacterium]
MLKFGKLLLPSVFILGAFVYMDRTERVWSPGVAAALLVLTWLWQRAHQQHRLAQAEGLLYRETFEQTLVGIAHLTKEGRLLRANPAFVDLLGYPKGELMRKTFQELTHPDDLAKGVELSQQVWNKLIPNYTLEKRYIRKDGGIVWGLLSVTLSTSESGEGKYFIANVKDITARKKAEVAFSESTLQLELATEAAQLGIWEYDIGTGKTYVRGRLWANMGFVSDSQSLVTLDFFERIHADDRELVRAHFRKTLETCTRYSCEYRLLAMDGRTVWLEGTGHPWEDDQGNIIRVMGVIRIITDRKLAEIDFQRSVDVSPAILWITEQDGQCV